MDRKRQTIIRSATIGLAGDDYRDAALSTTGRLALVREHVDTDLWKLNLASLLKSGSADLEPIANSTRVETNPKVSPDGKKIAFESNRAGFTEVWTANMDGSNPLPLTAMQNPGTVLRYGRTMAAGLRSNHERTAALESL